MNSFTVGLVSNASSDCWGGWGEWENGRMQLQLAYPSLYQNITVGKFFNLDEATPNTNPSD